MDLGLRLELINAQVSYNLRRDVVGCSKHSIGLLVSGIEYFSDSKITQFYDVLFSEEYILCLQIPAC